MDKGEGKDNVPEGMVQRDDGCLCPPEPPKKPPLAIKFDTCPYDPRFPNQNQTKRCYFSFIDYQRCKRLLGEYPGCDYFLKCYKALCPNSWIEKWFEQMEKGTFPRTIYPPKPIIYPEKCTSPDESVIEEMPPPPSGTPPPSFCL